jgi:iron complex outermembrane recepter protein
MIRHRGNAVNKRIVGIVSLSAMSVAASVQCFAGQNADSQSANGQSTNSQSANSDSSSLQEIIVTASKTGAQLLQRTPLAVSAFSGAQIQDQQIANVKDLVQYTPNLQVAQSTASAEIFIRGIGSTNVFAGSDPDVTVQIDGVYISRPSSQFADLSDIARVEVLRGPQGTLYGRNAAGGTINVISQQPSDTFTADTAVTVGSDNLVQTRDYISGPLADHVQASLAVSYQRHDGYIRNIAPGGQDIEDANRGSVRAQLRVEPTDRLDATTRVDWSALDENYESYDHILVPVLTPVPAPLANSTLNNYHEVAMNSPQVITSHNGGISEDINFQLTKELTFKSITAYRVSDYDLDGDSDATELYSSALFQSERQHQFSEELTAQANAGPFQGVAGLYYLTEHIASAISTIIPPAGITRGTDPAVNDESKAIYAQGTYAITERLHATLGARETFESKDIAPYSYTMSAVTGAILGPTFTSQAGATYNAFTPKFGLDYQVTDNAMLFASATKGFKSGGFNYSARTVATQSFGPEQIWSYETGAKTDWFDRHLRVNLTGFLYHYTGLQVQSLLSPGNIYIGNANSARVKGLELETIAKPLAGLTLTTNVSLLDAVYGPFPNASVAAGIVPFVVSDPRYNPTTTFFNATDNRLTDAPHVSALEAVQYDYRLAGAAMYGRIEYSYQSKTYFDPTNVAVLSQGGYGLWNVAVGYQTADSPWKFQALVKNLTNKQYLITAAAPGSIPTGDAGPPRTVWLTASRQW